jgi:iron complex outermembrane receptor protein
MSKRLLFPMALSLSALASPTFAQSSDGGTLEEIVVTAQKRAEDLQDVPIAISAYTSAARDLLGISTIQDLTNFTPGLSYSTSLDRASLRGIGRHTNNLASDPGLATYNDGFYNVSTRAAARSPLLVDRIEVLRGPQGTLYGRNSIGGTINVISKQPTTDWYAEVRAQYDNWDRKVAEGAASGPITDWLRFRVAAAWEKQDKGYFNNLATGKDEGGISDEHYFEAQLAADLGESVDVWFKASLSGYDNSRRSSYNDGDFDYALLPATYLVAASAFPYALTNPAAANIRTVGGQYSENPAKYNNRNFVSDMRTRNHQEDSPTWIMHVNWDMGPASLKYVGGYQSYEYLLQTDYDGTNVVEYTVPLNSTAQCAPPACNPLRYLSSSVSNYVEDKKYWSHELNLTSNGDGALQWILGAYLYDEKYKQPVDFPTPHATTHAPLYYLGGTNYTAAPLNERGTIYYIDTHLHTTSKAAFAQLDWSATDTLKFTTGLRYTEDRKEGKELTRQLCYSLTPALGCADFRVAGTNAVAVDVTRALIYSPLLPPPPGTTGAPTVDAAGIWSRGFDQSWDAVTGTAGAEWNPMDDSLLYLKYSRGYKAGGFNTGTITALPMTDPEFVNAYELGWKQQLGGRLQLNASVFFYDYKDMQIPLTFIPPAGPPQTPFVNLAKVESTGVEFETIWAPIDDLQVLFNYAYLNAEVKEACCFVDGVDTGAIQPEANPSGPASGTNQGQTLVGETVPQSPKHKAALNVNYTFHFAAGSLNVGATDIWKDETYFSVFNRWYNLAPSYNQVDARMTWTSEDNHYSIIAYGRNILDEDGFDGAGAGFQNQIPLGGPNVRTIPRVIARNYSLTPPRTYGMELQYRF